jgi:copper(I)-binding protein
LAVAMALALMAAGAAASSCGTDAGATSIQVPNGPLLADLSVTEGDRITSGYMVITAPGGGDRLLAASSPSALRVSVHGTADTQSMVALGGLELPGSEPVRLVPGGRHLMLEGLSGPVVPGDRVELTLEFEQAGPVTVEAPVVALVDVLDLYGGG